MNRAFLKGMSAYRDVDVKSRVACGDQHALVRMMFDGLLESITRAKGAVIRKDTMTKVSEVSKAIRILQEGLLSSLDIDKGGALAQNLADLYEYCVIRLTQANVQSSVEALDEVYSLIKSVADAWSQMRHPTSEQADNNVVATDEASAKPATTPSLRRVSHAYGGGLSLQGA